MFWSAAKPGSAATDVTITEIVTEEEFNKLGTLDLAVLFKHSPTCIVSLSANSRVRKFAAGCPEVPIFLVSVVRQRALSRRIAALTGVRHESPQIIVFRGGNVVGSMSHEGVTVVALESAVRAADAASVQL